MLTLMVLVYTVLVKVVFGDIFTHQQGCDISLLDIGYGDKFWQFRIAFRFESLPQSLCQPSFPTCPEWKRNYSACLIRLYLFHFLPLQPTPHPPSSSQCMKLESKVFILLSLCFFIVVYHSRLVSVPLVSPVRFPFFRLITLILFYDVFDLLFADSLGAPCR